MHFPVSCAASVQKPFERGVALLHSFWYEEAEKEFTQIAKDDPSCAMAHWGVAMSLWHQLWDHPNAATIKRGQAELKKAQSLHPKTDRERDYIAALQRVLREEGRSRRNAPRPTRRRWKASISAIRRIARRRHFMRSRCWRPNRTATPHSPIAKKRLQCWKHFSRKSPTIPEWRTT